MIRIDKTTLYQALSVLSRVANRKSSIPAVRCVRLDAQNGALIMTATDVVQTLTAQIPCEGEITTCLPSKPLANLVRPSSKKDRGTVRLETIDNNRISIETNELTTKLFATDPTNFPQRTEQDWILVATWDAKSLAQSLGYVLPAMCTDDTRPHLYGVYFDAAGKLVATDGHRAQIAPLQTGFEKSMLLPAASALLLYRILSAGDQVTIDKAEDRIKIRVGQWILETTLVNAVFPPYEQAIPNADQPIQLTVKTRSLAKALKRIDSLSETHGVKIVVNDVINISSSDPDVGETTVVVEPVENIPNGPDLEIGFNIVYLIDAIKGTDKARLCLSDSLSPLRVDLDDGRLSVVMPMRL
jgi:DNA polymerase-3 subunit beta